MNSIRESAAVADRFDVRTSKPYPAYKPSGVEWLGEVPAHWEVRRLGQIGAFSKGRGGNKEDESQSGVPCIRYGDLYTTYRYFIERSRSFVPPEHAANYTPIKFGDLLFAASGETMEEIGRSAVNLIPSDACCGGDVILFRVRRAMDARYLGYAADCRPAAAHKATMGRGFTVIHIYTSQLKNLSLALPPLSEQTAIARFLDYMDRRITRYIGAKKKLISLLEEYRQVLVSDAVMGRFDVRTGKPYPAYEPSGVEWLGDVPVHWEVRRLGQIGAFSKGRGGSKEDESSSGVSCIRYGDLYTTHRYFIERSRSFVPPERAASYTPIKFGDLLFAASGETIEEIGKSAVNLISSDACCGGDVILFRPRRAMEARYLGYAADCRPAAAHKATMGRGFTVVHIYTSQIKHLNLALPPLPEQAAIARFLDRKIEKIRKGIAQAQSEIDLLREYRIRLIADVVTGKLDVREAASTLPEADPPISGDGTSDSAGADDASASDFAGQAA